MKFFSVFLFFSIFVCSFGFTKESSSKQLTYKLGSTKMIKVSVPEGFTVCLHQELKKVMSIELIPEGEKTFDWSAILGVIIYKKDWGLIPSCYLLHEDFKSTGGICSLNIYKKDDVLRADLHHTGISLHISENGKKLRYLPDTYEIGQYQCYQYDGDFCEVKYQIRYPVKTTTEKEKTVIRQKIAKFFEENVQIY